MPANTTLSIWKGNTFELPLRLKTGSAPFDLSASALVFIAKWTDADGAVQTIRKETGVDAGFVITDAAAGEATLTLDVTETRLLPLGQSTRFEIEERSNGKQKTRLFGDVIVSGWVNDD